MKNLRIEESQLYSTRKRLIETALKISEDGGNLSALSICNELGRTPSTLRANPHYQDIRRWINCLKDGQRCLTPQPESFDFDPKRHEASRDATLNRVVQICEDLVRDGQKIRPSAIARALGINTGHLWNTPWLLAEIKDIQKQALKKAKYKPLPDCKKDEMIWSDGQRKIIELAVPVHTTDFRTAIKTDCFYQLQKMTKHGWRHHCYMSSASWELFKKKHMKNRAQQEKAS